MRTLRLLLLIVALIVGQAQVCRAVYVCQDGKVCEACPGTNCGVDDASCNTFSASDDEEQGCCKLTACENHQEAEKSVSQPAFDASAVILTAPLELPEPPIEPVRQVRLLWLVSHRPQAPPGVLSSRAPPALSA